MKKMLILFMLLTMPLQAAWAVASAYCQHEQGAAVQHFGHHAHQHQVSEKSDPGGGPASSVHADCAFCHLGGVGAVSSSLDVPASPPAFPVVLAEDAFFPSICLEGPERPKWAAVV
jgi:hypothetical protein